MSLFQNENKDGSSLPVVKRTYKLVNVFENLSSLSRGIFAMLMFKIVSEDCKNVFGIGVKVVKLASFFFQVSIVYSFIGKIKQKTISFKWLALWVV